MSSAGNIGIGTVTPQSKLDIEGGITIGATYSGSNAAPTNGAIIEGNVGIGTVVPSSKLHVSNAGSEGFEFYPGYTTNVNIFQGYNRWSTVYTSLDSRFADYHFKVGSTEKLTINTSGFVGIGATSPGYLLTISGTNPQLSIANSTAGNETSILFNTNISGKSNWYVGQNEASIGQGNFGFYGTSYGQVLTLQGNNGYVGIGTATPGYLLTVNGQPAANGYTQFTNYSDAKLKTNITDIDSCLNKILRLHPVKFNYNQDYLKLVNDSIRPNDAVALQKVHKGFIAQEVNQIFPEMVGTSTVKGKTYFDLNLSYLQVYLVKAIQEQQKLIIGQQQQLNLKDSVSTTMQNQINQLIIQVQQLQNPK